MFDLTTPAGIAAACKSAEGRDALLEAATFKPCGSKLCSPMCRCVECAGAQERADLLARTALPLALAELARVQGEAERYKAVVEWALSCRAENTREWLGNLAALFTKADGERRWVYDPGQDTFRCQPQTAADAAGGE